MTTWVKICGVTRLEDARAAFDSGADAIGINFWPQSRRYCEPARARDLVAALSPDQLVYGVFVDLARDEIEDVVREVGLGGVQLHGSEPPAEAEGWEIPVLRAIRATSADAIREAMDQRESAGYAFVDSGEVLAVSERSTPPYRLLVDNAAGGGSGQRIDSSVLDGVDLSESILAGGLTPQNVTSAVSRFRPFGVDTAGSVESSPGIKDARKIAAFVAAARASTARQA